MKLTNSQNVLLNQASQVIGASVTKQVVSEVFGLSDISRRSLVVKITAADVTVTTGITAKLQHGVAGTFFDSADVAIAGNGSVLLQIDAANGDEGVLLPLGDTARVVITTGTGDAVTVTAVVAIA